MTIAAGRPINMLEAQAISVMNFQPCIFALSAFNSALHKEQEHENKSHRLTDCRLFLPCRSRLGRSTDYCGGRGGHWGHRD